MRLFKNAIVMLGCVGLGFFGSLAYTGDLDQLISEVSSVREKSGTSIVGMQMVEICMRIGVMPDVVNMAVSEGATTLEEVYKYSKTGSVR